MELLHFTSLLQCTNGERERERGRGQPPQEHLGVLEMERRESQGWRRGESLGMGTRLYRESGGKWLSFFFFYLAFGAGVYICMYDHVSWVKVSLGMGLGC